MLGTAAPRTASCAVRFKSDSRFRLSLRAVFFMVLFLPVGIVSRAGENGGGERFSPVKEVPTAARTGAGKPALPNASNPRKLLQKRERRTAAAPAPAALEILNLQPKGGKAKPYK
jgi:hypothetical protein